MHRLFICTATLLAGLTVPPLQNWGPGGNGLFEPGRGLYERDRLSDISRHRRQDIRQVVPQGLEVSLEPQVKSWVAYEAPSPETLVSVTPAERRHVKRQVLLEKLNSDLRSLAAQADAVRQELNQMARDGGNGNSRNTPELPRSPDLPWKKGEGAAWARWTSSLPYKGAEIPLISEDTSPQLRDHRPALRKTEPRQLAMRFEFGARQSKKSRATVKQSIGDLESKWFERDSETLRRAALMQVELEQFARVWSDHLRIRVQLASLIKAELGAFDAEAAGIGASGTYVRSLAGIGYAQAVSSDGNGARNNVPDSEVDESGADTDVASFELNLGFERGLGFETNMVSGVSGASIAPLRQVSIRTLEQAGDMGRDMPHAGAIVPGRTAKGLSRPAMSSTPAVPLAPAVSPETQIMPVVANLEKASTNLTKPAEADPVLVDVVPDIDRRELVLALQRELKRAGCAPGAVDGNWGPKSRAALDRFVNNYDVSFDPDLASMAALEAVSIAAGRICPVECSGGAQLIKGRCVQTVSAEAEEEPVPEEVVQQKAQPARQRSRPKAQRPAPKTWSFDWNNLN